MQNVLPLACVSSAAPIVSLVLRGEHANLLVFNDTGDHWTAVTPPCASLIEMLTYPDNGIIKASFWMLLERSSCAEGWLSQDQQHLAQMELG